MGKGMCGFGTAVLDWSKPLPNICCCNQWVDSKYKWEINSLKCRTYLGHGHNVHAPVESFDSL